MEELIAHVGRYGLTLVFINVLLEQLGLPIPAIPTLIVAGALTVRNDLSVLALLGCAVGASLIGDTVWFFLGRKHGFRVLKTVCRISISPESCVKRTESIFERWGLLSLVFAKFIPGYSTVAPPLAGGTNVSLGRFLFYDAIGSALWAGSGIVSGIVFHRAIDRAVDLLANLGKGAIAVLLAALTVVILVKWRRRQRLMKQLRMDRITVHELRDLIEGGVDPLVVDVRSSSARSFDPRQIPGSIAIDSDSIESHLSTLAGRAEVVLYCT